MFWKKRDKQQPTFLCAIISEEKGKGCNTTSSQSTSIERYIPINDSEKEEDHRSQKHNNNVHSFEHHIHGHYYGHIHVKEPALVADDHSHNHMQPNHTYYDQANQDTWQLFSFSTQPPS